MRKVFRKAAHEMEPLASGRGSCIASDRISVDGMQVGYMYREAVKHGLDSGWRFFAGDETESYTEAPGNFAVYDVNTIANYDRSIVALLDCRPPCAFERDPDSDSWVSVLPPHGEEQ